MAKEAGGKKLSVIRRIGGFLLILLTMAGGLAIGFFYTGGWGIWRQVDDQAEPSTASSVLALSVLLFICGVFFSGLGIALYGLIIATKCFTSDFSKPFWDGFKKKLYAMNIIVPTLFIFGVASFVGMALAPILAASGVSLAVIISLCLIGTYVVLQLISLWFCIWTPLDKLMIENRMVARGIPQDFISRGIRIGISDPSKSSMKKFTMIEDDVGMLWLGNETIVYRGDTGDITIRRNQLLTIERAADAWNVSALFGNVNVLITFQRDDGSQRKVRLHSESGWTMTAKARASDKLEEMLLRWKDGAAGIQA